MYETKKAKVIYFITFILAAIILCACIFTYQLSAGVIMADIIKQVIEIFALCIATMIAGYFLEVR